MSEYKQQLKDAKIKGNLNLSDKLIAVLEVKRENEELDIPEDYEVCLKAILKYYDKPLPLSFISQVLPDSAQLLKVRKLLRKATDERPQEIEEYKDGEAQTRTMIKLIPVAVPEPKPVEPAADSTASTPKATA